MARMSYLCPVGEAYNDTDGNGGILELEAVTLRANRIHSA